MAEENQGFLGAVWETVKTVFWALIIAGIFRDGPAHKGGLLPGDILLEINGNKIVNSYNSMYSVARLLPGTKLPMKVWRNGEVIELTITVAERPASDS